jgi:hypothetical protein
MVSISRWLSYTWVIDIVPTGLFRSLGWADNSNPAFEELTFYAYQREWIGNQKQEWKAQRPYRRMRMCCGAFSWAWEE